MRGEERREKGEGRDARQRRGASSPPLPLPSAAANVKRPGRRYGSMVELRRNRHSMQDKPAALIGVETRTIQR
jgi:hypothetical protein